jgi:hypothetical protein
VGTQRPLAANSKRAAFTREVLHWALTTACHIWPQDEVPFIREKSAALAQFAEIANDLEKSK